jgi:exonuclease III
MTSFTLISHNIHGRFQHYAEEINEFLRKDSLNVICLQDIGYIGPEGPNEWRTLANSPQIYTNYSPLNKSRNVAVAVSEAWDVSKVERDDQGGLLGVTIHHDELEVKIISAYLPPCLDLYGKPDRAPRSNTPQATRQREALKTYETILKWIKDTSNWIVVGDLNETRKENLDRKWEGDHKRQYCRASRKFIEEFLQISGGIDVWRRLHPSTANGHTRRDPVTLSTARLDYAIISPSLLGKKAWHTHMRVGGAADQGSDHQPLYLSLTYAGKLTQKPSRPWSIRRPAIPVGDEERREVASSINKDWVKSLLGPPASPDERSRQLATFMVKETGKLTGFIGGPHGNPLCNRQTSKILRLIRAVKRIIEYHRESQENGQNERLMELMTHYFEVLGRYHRVPMAPPFTYEGISGWVRDHSGNLLKALRVRANLIGGSIMSRYQQTEDRLFRDQCSRSRWLSTVGLGKQTKPPPRAIVDSKSARIIRDPAEIKRVYVQEGASLLQNRKELPPHPAPHDFTLDAPDLKTRKPFKKEEKKLHTGKPAWWDKMYCRHAKGIQSETWAGLMERVSSQELRETIQDMDKHKAPGYDGVNSDLVKLLTLSSENEAILGSLLDLVNEALGKGLTLESWRKSMISMVPKKKEDGSYTSTVAEMRPISVMQEFAKIASKILANRLGRILLESPTILNRAQRAFLRNGCINQCILTAINIFEDFRERKNQGELFLITYDQQKAYDSVQKFTIQASLERFNLPEKFISYVVSLLEESTSCFKTFYGPTEDFDVKTSVRQGDPLSPLIYILITDALHAGLKDNPLGPPLRTRSGYVFSNDSRARINSSGYADDMMTFAQTWEGVWTMHQWVMEFCKAHYFKINVDKCRYIISNCSGESDNRWLPSADGKTALRPTGPDTVFRYLGIWLSMNLNWEKQIQVLNKSVMTWRSVVVRNRISSLKAATTVRDHLFPKLELGLQFAEIDEKTCNGWSKTIIHTILENSGISAMFARSLNTAAFCSLAGIPDV